jgi:hypothetical protein
MNRLVVPLAVAFTIALTSSASAHHHHWRSCGCYYDYCGAASCCAQTTCGAPTSCCAPSSCCAPVSCDSAATTSGDSAATSDQSVATSDSTSPSTGESAAPWSDDDEKRFAECTKKLKPALKQQILDEMKKMSRAERDEEILYYEKEAEKSKDQGKSSGDNKTGQKTEARRSQPIGAPRSKLTNAQPAAMTTVIMLEPVR